VNLQLPLVELDCRLENGIYTEVTIRRDRPICRQSASTTMIAQDHRTDANIFALSEPSAELDKRDASPTSTEASPS